MMFLVPPSPLSSFIAVVRILPLWARANNVGYDCDDHSRLQNGGRCVMLVQKKLVILMFGIGCSSNESWDEGISYMDGNIAGGTQWLYLKSYIVIIVVMLEILGTIFVATLPPGLEYGYGVWNATVL